MLSSSLGFCFKVPRRHFLCTWSWSWGFALVLVSVQSWSWFWSTSRTLCALGLETLVLFLRVSSRGLGFKVPRGHFLCTWSSSWGFALVLVSVQSWSWFWGTLRTLCALGLETFVLFLWVSSLGLNLSQWRCLRVWCEWSNQQIRLCWYNRM